MCLSFRVCLIRDYSIYILTFLFSSSARRALYRKKWREADKELHAKAFFDAIPVAWKLSADKITQNEIIDLSLGRKIALDAYAIFKKQ